MSVGFHRGGFENVNPVRVRADGIAIGYLQVWCDGSRGGHDADEEHTDPWVLLELSPYPSRA